MVHKSYLETALQYADAGIKIFPCDSVSKKPLTRNGFKDSTVDKKKIKRWWDKNPAALIGAACDDQFMIVDVDLKNGAEAFESLGKIHKFVSKTQTRTTTMSNGSHYYFKYDESVARRINVIPSIDVLGRGGYAILPDGDRYVQSGSIEQFIAGIGSLPELDERFCAHIRREEELPSLAEYREAVPVKSRKSTSEPVNREKSPEQIEEDELAEALLEVERASHNKMYQPIGKNAGTQQIDYTGETIEFLPGTLTSAMVNGLFYNKAIQKRIATHLGVPIPDESTGRSKAFKSTLPKHKDDNPSFGARWKKGRDGDYILVRDFSDYFSNGKTDYNLVRLFIISRYGRNYRKPSPTEFTMWLVKLLEEAGVIKTRQDAFKGIDKVLTKSESKVVKGFLQLMSFKKLWKGGSEETCYSQKFAAAWTGVSGPVVSSAKSKIIKFGCVEKVGTWGEGKFSSPVFAYGKGVIRKDEIRTISEMIFAVNRELKNKIATNHQRRVLGKPRTASVPAVQAAPPARPTAAEGLAHEPGDGPPKRNLVREWVNRRKQELADERRRRE